MSETPMAAAVWAKKAKNMLVAERIKVLLSKVAADASIVADGVAKGTNAGNVAALFPHGHPEGVSATLGVAHEEEVTIVGDFAPMVRPPAATPASATESAGAASTRNSAHTSVVTLSAAAAASVEVPGFSVEAAAAASTQMLAASAAEPTSVAAVALLVAQVSAT